MIDAVTIEGFRGLQRLEVDGFGRVNLIIGKNDCGKTSLMEALWIADGPEGASHRAAQVQTIRHSAKDMRDFDRFWRTLFWDQDADRGFSVTVRGARPDPLRIRFHKSAPPTVVPQFGDATTAPAAWAMAIEIADQGEPLERIVASSRGLGLPPHPAHARSTWITPNRGVGALEISRFSKLKQSGQEQDLLGVLRDVDGRISAIEILAPAGTAAELFVRLEPGTPLLPLSAMGDGFQRCFEIGAAVTAEHTCTLYIDETENGFHHSVLEPVWRWLATLSAKRDLQVFATTHSEECIHAAARAFTALDDDGLRVIRLDRREDRTTAAVYTRDLVEATERMGVEIRG